MWSFLKFLALTTVSLGLSTCQLPAFITADTVNVGNAGNISDPLTGLGSVGYDYRIGKREVTLFEYAVFLNATAATDSYGLYNPSMGSDLVNAGIIRSGVPGSYSYAVAGTGDRPVKYVSWLDAVRFANWLHNNQPTGLQSASTTEAGAYTLNGSMGGAFMVARNSGAQFWVPSENEWYKAAYHQPASQGGDSDDYWHYPTQSNTSPLNSAPSFYGTLAQGENGYEWNDALSEFNIGWRGLRGNSGGPSTLYTFNFDSWEDSIISFRIAAVPVPEPTVLGLVTAGIILVVARKKCRSRR